MKINLLQEKIYLQFPISLEDLPVEISQCDMDTIIEFIKTISCYCESKNYYSDFTGTLASYFEEEFKRVNDIN